MKKIIIGTILGITVGIFTIGTIEALSNFLYPIPSDFDFENKPLVKNYIKNLPILALIITVLAHGLGTFIGSYLANKISKSLGVTGLIVTAFFFILTIVNLLIIPYHPIWFVIADILVVFIMGWTAFKISLKK